jgi:hypothetical protein
MGLDMISLILVTVHILLLIVYRACINHMMKVATHYGPRDLSDTSYCAYIAFVYRACINHMKWYDRWIPVLAYLATKKIRWVTNK